MCCILKIQLRRQIAVDIVADGFAHELFGDLKPFRQLPDLRTALGHGFIQILHGNQGGYGPFVRPVFMALAAFHCGVNVVEAAGNTVAQLMTQVDPLLGCAIADGTVQPHEAPAALQHHGQGAGLRQRVGEDLDVLTELCDRIIVIGSGRITGTLDGRTATKEQIGYLMTASSAEEKEGGEA